MNYTLVSFQPISEEQKELLIAILPEFGFHGMEETEDGLKAYTREADTDFEGLLTVSNQMGVEFQLETLEEENWNTTWESNFDPVVIPGKIQVRAHVHPPLDSVEHQILITPKMSFGTGHHPTTLMMMLAMLEIDFKGKKVIDFGTGTGILSILAEKLGAIHIEAIDNDDWSINNVIENIGLNEAKTIQVIKASTLDVSTPADVVLANINKNVLIEHVQDLFKYTRENGTLIISGLLRTDYEDILNVFVPVFGPFSKSFYEGDWLALTFERKV
jgi:ribosomal protein L11 methyltransferase